VAISWSSCSSISIHHLAVGNRAHTAAAGMELIVLLAAAAAESADPAHYRMANTEPWQPLVPIIQFISSYGCIELGVFFFLQTKRTVRTLDGCISFEVLFSIIKNKLFNSSLVYF